MATKITLAQSLLLPLLDYGDVAWLDLSEELFNKMERLQNVCIRFIFGHRKFDHVSEFRQQLGWHPIRIRRNVHILTFLYKILFYAGAPSYLHERLQLRVVDDRLRSCGSRQLDIPMHNSNTYTNSFTVKAAMLWNSLPTQVRMAPSVDSFRSRLDKFLGI